jgi:ferrochelatase
METTAVLLMAYGSPDSLDEMEDYLLDIRSGRPTSPVLVDEMRERYARIGGRSPLLDLTRSQAAALEEELNRSACLVYFKTYVGMRHWKPRIRQAVAAIAADGIQRLVGLVMAPHASRMSSGAYFGKLEEAVRELDTEMETVRIDSWHNHPGLIEALAEKAAAAIASFEYNPFVLFTAHSLPVRILKEGDPYDAQLRETATLVAEKLRLSPTRWQFCYQSSGQSQEPWLGPQVGEMIAKLAQAGEKNMMITPVGFLCDHVEILYDLDIEAQAIAREHGVRLARSESLNTSPTFISALADLVLTYAYPVSRN